MDMNRFHHTLQNCVLAESTSVIQHLVFLGLELPLPRFTCLQGIDSHNNTITLITITYVGWTFFLKIQNQLEGTTNAIYLAPHLYFFYSERHITSVGRTNRCNMSYSQLYFLLNFLFTLKRTYYIGWKV